MGRNSLFSRCDFAAARWRENWFCCSHTFRRQGVKLAGDWQSKIPHLKSRAVHFDLGRCAFDVAQIVRRLFHGLGTRAFRQGLATGEENIISFPELEPFLFTAGLVNFFSAAQIATRFFTPRFCEIYFLAFLFNKNGLFVNQVPLGIGIA